MVNELNYIDRDVLRRVLDEAYERLKEVYITTSVLGPVRSYSGSDIDREFWALFCALLDFQVPVTTWLNPMLDGLRLEIEEMGENFSSLFFDRRKAKSLLLKFKWRNRLRKGFSHRFVTLEDVLCLFKVFKEILVEHGGLRPLAEAIYFEKNSIEILVKSFAEELRRRFLKCSSLKTFIPSPRGRSAMKRLLLFLRWMVRPYPDLCLWKDVIDKSRLLVSLDSGVVRVVNRLIGSKIVGKADWNSVLKVTEFLKNINSEDPAKYDYVLSRPAIMGYCTKRLELRKCVLCPLAVACSSSNVGEIKVVEEGVTLVSKRESRILEKFKSRYFKQLKIDKIFTEYPLGDRRADILFHTVDCTWWIGEVEEQLNYEAIGQAILYKLLFYKLKGKWAKAIVICSKAPQDMLEACKIDAGIKVFQINDK